MPEKYKGYDQNGFKNDELNQILEETGVKNLEQLSKDLDPVNSKKLNHTFHDGAIILYEGDEAQAFDPRELNGNELEEIFENFNFVPEWEIFDPISTKSRQEVVDAVNQYGVNTVCEEAECDNRDQCWSNEDGFDGGATFMIGNECSRNCGFCAVDTGVSKDPVDATEIYDIVKATVAAENNYVVVTSVDRDELLEDNVRSEVYGMAEALRDVVGVMPEEPAKDAGGIDVELLIPDFAGYDEKVRTTMQYQPDVVAHNIETVERLQQDVRDPRANYKQSLGVLETIDDFMNEKYEDEGYVKTSIMLGVGEEKQETETAIEDVAEAGVDVLVIGQYKSPSDNHIEMKERVPPERFEYFETFAYDQGLDAVVSNPLARTSYRAKEVKEAARSGEDYIMRFGDDQRTVWKPI